MAYSTVVVGTDGSPSATRAVQRAADVAADAGALLVVVCAYHPMSPREQALAATAVGDTPFFHVRGTAAAERVLAEAAALAETAGASGVTGVLVDGDPGQALLTAAQDRGADLIVVGNRGINTLSGRLLGSVPSDVSQRASCDVLIVHTTERGRT